MNIFSKEANKLTDNASKRSEEEILHGNTIWVSDDKADNYDPIRNGLGSVYEYSSNRGYYYVYIGISSFERDSSNKYTENSQAILNVSNITNTPLDDESIQNLLTEYFVDETIFWDKVVMTDEGK